jgi:hypothetical protein
MRPSHNPAPANPRHTSRCLRTWMRLLITVVVLLVLAGAAHADPRVGQPAPDVAGERWVNSAPLTITGLRGRVVLVEFWTYG